MKGKKRGRMIEKEIKAPRFVHIHSTDTPPSFFSFEPKA
jgi:hypothetical protein